MTWLDYQEPQQSKGLVRLRTRRPKKLRTETVGTGAPDHCLYCLRPRFGASVFCQTHLRYPERIL